MANQGFTTLPGLNGIAPHGVSAHGVARVVLRAVRAPYELLCLAFDWQWEQRQRAYERSVLGTMSARERADIGLGRRDDSDGSVSAFWRE